MSTALQSLVSVIVPCYNYGEFVGEAISSILRQDYSNFELIVIDDGSTDNSVDNIAKALQDWPSASNA